MPRVALAIALLSAVISWPALVPRYARSDTWRLDNFPWREALRIRTPDHYLETHLIGYGVDPNILFRVCNRQDGLSYDLNALEP